jgi:hypothetical protein
MKGAEMSGADRTVGRESTEKTEITEQTEIFRLVPGNLPSVPLFPSFPYSLFAV